MAAEVKILVEGYTNADSVAETGEEKTKPTITLVRDEDLVMVVDPGIMESQQVLVDALARENLTVDDVNFVFITHSHFDHYRNIGMFPDAKTLEYYGVWHEDTSEEWDEYFTSNIHVVHTPGHDYTGLTLFVTTNKGVVAICGDVFWRENYPRDPHDDVFASNPKRLKDSREMIVKMADWIIPGHGPMYKNNINAAEIDEEVSTTRATEPRITVACKKCGRQIVQREKCQCRPFLCFRCCECGIDCDLCGCSHKK